MPRATWSTTDAGAQPLASSAMLAGFISRSSRYRYTLLGTNSSTVTRKRISLLAAGLIVVVFVGGIAIWTFVDLKTLSIWPPPSLDDGPPLYQDPQPLDTDDHKSPPLESHDPTPLIDPHVDKLPPLFSQYHEHELRLPQQDWNRTEPEEHEKYFYVSGFRIDVGWGNAFQELLLNAYLTYRVGRTFVFANYTWSDDGSPYTQSFDHTIPSQIPYTALIRGPIVGEPWGTPYEHVRSAVTKTYFDHICPSKSELVREQVHSDLVYASNTKTIIGAWSKAVNNVTDPCLQTQKGSGQIFDHWETFGVPGNLASIWPDLISTPLLTYIAWSPLIELAFDINRDLFLPPSSLASTPYLSSLPYNTSAPTATTTTNAVRYPLIPGLMAIHVRQGDYASHCTTLASIGDPFISVNSFPSLPDQLVPPGNATSHGKLPVEWTGSPDQLEYYHRRCFPSIPEIVTKVLEVRSAGAGAGVRRLHIMTNGKPPYIAELKSALKDAAEWDSISSSRDLVLNWEQKFVSQAVDVLAAQRAQVLIGNGFSTLTSNAVIMRLANNFSTESIRFF